MPADEGLDALGLIGTGPPRMPGRGRWLAWTWGAVLVSVAAAVVATDLGASSVSVLPVAHLVALGIGPFAREARLRRALASDRYRTVTADAVAAAVLTATGPSGVREVTVRVGPVGGFCRCFRASGRAVVLVHERLPLRPDAARFIIAHEAAHLARYDVLRRSSGIMTALVCWFCLSAIWPPGLAVGALGTVAAIVAVNHTTELDCDRWATRWAGLAAAERAMALIQRAHRRSFRALLAHPSPRRRLAACRAD